MFEEIKDSIVGCWTITEVEEILDELSKKKFNPIEIGFNIDYESINELTYSYKDREIEDFSLVYNKTYNAYSLYSDGMSDHFNDIKIDNHSFGIALLKSTGAFEEGEF